MNYTNIFIIIIFLYLLLNIINLRYEIDIYKEHWPEKLPSLNKKNPNCFMGKWPPDTTPPPPKEEKKTSSGKFAKIVSALKPAMYVASVILAR